MGQISLSLGVRQNLLALQSTADLLADTQNRLATGKKVNSALDNPNSFFTASGLNNRANDLNNLLDDMGQGVQTIKAADQGITAITSLVESAKAKANQALQSQSQYERKTFAAQYNDLLGQIEALAKDAGYKGKNLLGGAGNDLTVNFNEDNTSKITVLAVNYTDTSLTTGLNLADLTAGSAATGTITLTAGTATTALTTGDTLVSDGEFADGDVLTFTDGNGFELGQLTVDTTTTVQDLIDKLDGFNGVSASLATTDLSISADFDLSISSSSASFNSGSDLDIDATDSGFATDAAINNVITSINTSLGNLRSQASTFGTNLSTVEIRQDFTKTLIDTLETGAGLLTLADTNKEGANLLALQTRQQLASASLSFASQADQNVLSLF